MAIPSSTLLYDEKAMGCGFFIFFLQQDLVMSPTGGGGDGASGSSSSIEEPNLDDETLIEIDGRPLDEGDISDMIALLELSGLVE